MDSIFKTEQLPACPEDADLLQNGFDQRVHYLRTLHDVSKDLFGSVDPEEILRHFLLMTMGNFGVVEGFILTATGSVQESEHFVSLGLDDDEAASLRVAALGVLREAEAAAEPAPFEPHPAHPLPGICCALLFEVKPEHSGLLGLGPKLIVDPYTDDDKELLLTLTNNLVVALKNAASFEEIKELNKSLQAKNIQLEEALDQLQTTFGQLNQAYQDLQAAQEQIIEKEKLERELLVAREIQRSILPCSLPSLAGFDIGARMVPARAVGGDFFDLIPLGPHALGVAVGDVSDKGVPAALFMAVTRSLIRAEADRSRSPGEVILSVNRHLLEMNEAAMFVTVLYGILDGISGEFDYVRAGHDPPMLFLPDGTSARPSCGCGQPLGIVPNPVLDRQKVNLPPGGTLLVYTDGVTDARDEKKGFFGLERLCETVCGCNPSAQGVCDHLVDAVTRFQGVVPQHDDLTLVAVHRASTRSAGSFTR